MKPLYSTPIAFKVMKEEPSSGIRKSPFVKSGIEDGHGRELVPPYRPGEKCYVPEAWTTTRAGMVLKLPERVLYKADFIGQEDAVDWVWSSPITMPMWAARRFVTVVSCEPVRVEDVTEEDARTFGEEHNLVCPRCENEGMIQDPAFTYIAFMLCPECKCTYRPLFIADWHKRHPDKEWAWRVVSGITG